MGAPFGNKNAAGSRGGIRKASKTRIKNTRSSIKVKSNANPLRKDKDFMKEVSKEKARGKYKITAGKKALEKKKAMEDKFKQYGREQKAARLARSK